VLFRERLGKDAARLRAVGKDVLVLLRVVSVVSQSLQTANPTLSGNVHSHLAEYQAQRRHIAFIRMKQTA
jgi:hypothetical protein